MADLFFLDGLVNKESGTESRLLGNLIIFSWKVINV